MAYSRYEMIDMRCFFSSHIHTTTGFYMEKAVTKLFGYGTVFLHVKSWEKRLLNVCSSL